MQLVKKENLVIKLREYEKDGVTKGVYKTIGELITFSDGQKQFQKVELYHIPEANISVYPQRDRQEQKAQQPEVDIDKIPF